MRLHFISIQNGYCNFEDLFIFKSTNSQKFSCKSPRKMPKTDDEIKYVITMNLSLWTNWWSWNMFSPKLGMLVYFKCWTTGNKNNTDTEKKEKKKHKQVR